MRTLRSYSTPRSGGQNSAPVSLGISASSAAQWALVFLVGASILGCAEKPQVKVEVKAPEVLVTEASSDYIIDYEEFTGRTEAKNTVEVKSRVQGFLDKVHFRDGDTVKEGDLLFEIDPRPYLSELQRAEASLVQNQARLKRLELDYQRVVTLRQRNAVSVEDFDKVKGDLGEADAAVGVARAELEKAKLNLEYAKVTVPTLDNGGARIASQPRTGRVSRRFVDPGNLIKADETLLTTIVTLNPMYVYFDVDERTVLRLRELVREKKITNLQEMTFRFGLANEEGKYPYQGKINFEDNRIDAGTGTLRLRGEFDNTRGIDPGLFTRIRLYLGAKRKAVLLPERALGTDQGQKFLYVVKEETNTEGKQEYTAKYRGGEELELGALRDGWRVIEKGVAPGEWIIWSGLQRVRKDARISPKLEKPPVAKTLNGQ